MSTLDAAAAAELVAALRGEARQGVEPIQVISAFQVPRVKYDPIRHAFYLAPGPAPLLGTAEVPLRPALFAEPQGSLLLSKSHIGGCYQPVWPGLLHPVGRPACSAFHLASGPAPLLRQPGAAAVSLLRSRKAYFVKVCPNCSPCCTFLACSAVPHMRLLLRQCISLCWLCRGRRVDQTGAGPEQEAGLGPARALLAGLPGAATPLLSLSTPASLRRPQSGGQQAARAALRQSTAGPRLRARAACPAMEGPTPVSALIHAATMVTAGVFMIARCSPLFEYAPTALMVVAFLGGMTCFFAATTGLVQNDIKRVIAYSTCSQLGYMVFACGLSQYSLGVFHLMNHAFFKALLFLSAGSVIHALSDEQDMRKMGGVVQLLPFTYSMMMVGSLSLAGFPFLTGFYSKDVILEVAYATYTLSGNFAYWLGSICVLMTSYYSFRLLFLTFLTPTSAFKSTLNKTHEAPFLMAFPLILLALGSIFVGYLGKDMMIGLGTNFWGNSLFVLPKNLILLESEYIPQTQKWVPLVWTALGIGLAFLFNYALPQRGFRLKTSWLGRKLYTMLNRRWFFDKVYNDFISQKALDFGYNISWKTIDKGCLEILGPYGIAHTMSAWSKYVSRLQSGLIYHYAVMMLLGLSGAIAISIAMTAPEKIFENFIDFRLYFILPLGFFIFNSLPNNLSASYESNKKII